MCLVKMFHSFEITHLPLRSDSRSMTGEYIIEAIEMYRARRPKIRRAGTSEG